MTGNIKLVPFGIKGEGSDYRIHICFLEGYTYIFFTKNAIWQIEHRWYPYKPAFQELPDGARIITAWGWCVPPLDIEGCKRIKIPGDISKKNYIRFKENESIKGEKAAKISKIMLARGLIPIKIKIEETSLNDQIKGVDFTTGKPLKLQAKCDYRGGIKGTGNLYLQDKECNPHGLH